MLAKSTPAAWTGFGICYHRYQLLQVVITSTDPAFACRVAGAFAKVAPTEIVRITKARRRRDR